MEKVMTEFLPDKDPARAELDKARSEKLEAVRAAIAAGDAEAAAQRATELANFCHETQKDMPDIFSRLAEELNEAMHRGDTDLVRKLLDNPELPKQELRFDIENDDAAEESVRNKG